MYVLISIFCLTLSVFCYFNKHIHAKVVSDLGPIQYHCDFSVFFCGWFIQPLTGGSLWTSEHIRRQTQEPSALIMSDHSVHGREIHRCPLSLSLSPTVSFSFSLTYSLIHMHTIYFTYLRNFSHSTFWHLTSILICISGDYQGHIKVMICYNIIFLEHIIFANNVYIVYINAHSR